MKVIVACKICSKEQPFKQPSSWKQHYYTHSDKKPHACTLCSKSFIRPVLLRQHMEKYHSGQSQVRHIKTEAVKFEDFWWNNFIKLCWSMITICWKWFVDGNLQWTLQRLILSLFKSPFENEMKRSRGV